jgi:hypothetical protein
LHDKTKRTLPTGPHSSPKEYVCPTIKNLGKYSKIHIIIGAANSTVRHVLQFLNDKHGLDQFLNLQLIFHSKHEKIETPNPN